MDFQGLSPFSIGEIMTIRKVKGGYVAWSSTKGRLSKKPKSYTEAKQQHEAVMASKARRRKRKK